MKILERERTETICVDFEEWNEAVDKYGLEETAAMLKPRIGNWKVGAPRSYHDAYVYITFIEKQAPVFDSFMIGVEKIDGSVAEADRH